MIIYHSKDLDGITSGALLKQAYPEARLQGYDHSEPIDFEMAENIIFADIGFKIDQMYELSKTSNIIWIDHHISSENKYLAMSEEKGDFLEAVFDTGHAACINVFKWLYPDKHIPNALQLLGDYDIWNNSNIDSWYNEILPFQYGIRSICNSVDEFPLDVFIDEKIMYDVIDIGMNILTYQKKINELTCRKNSFEINYRGYKVICLNITGANFLTFESIYNKNKHDMVMSFYFDGLLWHVSMYTDKDNVDCSILAEIEGGGGHKKAAGFEVEDIKTIIC